MTINSAAKTLQDDYAEEVDLWRQFINGGWITCKSPQTAVALRYRLYTARKLMQRAFGRTNYDNLAIKIAKGDNRLRIEPRDSGVVELLPDEPQSVLETVNRVRLARGLAPPDKDTKP